MPDQHTQKFRVGKSKYHITVFQGVDPATSEWKDPIIIVPEMPKLNVPAANAAATAINKAAKACQALNKYTGRPAR